MEAPLGKRALTTVSTLMLTAASLVVIGAAAPTAHAGLLCSADNNYSTKTTSSVCRNYSGNRLTEVRAIANCSGGVAVGPWVNGSRATSRATCTGDRDYYGGRVEMRP
jgi:hypothetical protein